MELLSRSLPSRQNGFYSSSFRTSKSPLASADQRQSTAKSLKPFVTEDIKILLLENVNKIGQDLLSQQGYQVESLKTSLSEDELLEKIRYTSTVELLKYEL